MFDRVVYAACRALTTLALTALYRHRVFGAGNVPREGAFVLVSNHQSHLDPPVIGTSAPRRVAMNHWYQNACACSKSGVGSAPGCQPSDSTAARSRRAGSAQASRQVMRAPQSWPASAKRDRPSASAKSRTSCAIAAISPERGVSGEWKRVAPKPRSQGA